MSERLPAVSVVVPNWNGRHHLERCFQSLHGLDYPGEVELILVDNGSRDGSIARMREKFPDVVLLENRSNEGFAAACNRGVREAAGEVVAFLNNDMRVDPGWLRELVRPLAAGQAGCTGSLILSWDGKRINYAGGGMNFHGMGIQLGHDRPVEEYEAQAGDTLFACGGAMAIGRKLFLDAGGFDERFFAYYEDVDLGWRLWVLGETVRLVPTSLSYHHHSATSNRMEAHRVRLLQIRNPLLTLFKNYDDENVRRALPAAVLLTLMRTRYQLRLAEEDFDVGQGSGLTSGPLAELRAKTRAKLSRTLVSRAGLADIMAVTGFLQDFPEIEEDRASIQGRRRRGDEEILHLFRDPRWAVEPTEEYGRIQADLIRFFGLDEVLPDDLR